MTRVLSAVLLGFAGMALTACASGPPPAVYVLGMMPPAMTGTASQAELPVVVIRPVMIPDYLDTTDLVIRSGGEVIPSRTGRWGERLSAGMTRALAAGLADRLPGVQVTTSPPLERPARQIFTDVETFEARADGQVVLAARWSVTDGTGRNVLAAERTAVVMPVEGNGDAAVAAAMTRCIDDLAGRVAGGVEAARQAEKLNQE